MIYDLRLPYVVSIDFWQYKVEVEKYILFILLQTPLHQAVLDGKTEAVKLLLQYGADMSRTDQAGMSAFDLVKNIGQQDLVDIFTREDGRVL